MRITRMPLPYDGTDCGDLGGAIDPDGPWLVQKLDGEKPSAYCCIFHQLLFIYSKCRTFFIIILEPVVSS